MDSTRDSTKDRGILCAGCRVCSGQDGPSRVLEHSEYPGDLFWGGAHQPAGRGHVVDCAYAYSCSGYVGAWGRLKIIAEQNKSTNKATLHLKH